MNEIQESEFLTLKPFDLADIKISVNKPPVSNLSFKSKSNKFFFGSKIYRNYE